MIQILLFTQIDLQLILYARESRATYIRHGWDSLSSSAGLSVELPASVQTAHPARPSQAEDEDPPEWESILRWCPDSGEAGNIFDDI